MILLEVPHATDSCRLILVIGNGLLGSSVTRALTAAHPALRATTFPLSWGSPSLLTAELAAVERAIRSHPLARLATAHPARVRILWCAGTAGFSATEDELATELECFRAAVSTAARLAATWPAADVGFVLLSSAGGLFEGQRLVDETSEPRPLRPYGKLKARQEELLLAAAAGFSACIFRLSSAYGYIDPRHRQGLIPTLLHNGLLHRVSTLSGTASTLRDFVWVEDVARFVASELLRPGGEQSPVIRFLCSGRPTSLGEILHRVERTLGRKIYLHFSPGPTNAADITFSPRLLPPTWRPAELEVCIANLHRQAMTGQRWPAAPEGCGRNAEPTERPPTGARVRALRSA